MASETGTTKGKSGSATLSPCEHTHTAESTETGNEWRWLGRWMTSWKIHNSVGHERHKPLCKTKHPTLVLKMHVEYVVLEFSLI